MKAFLLKKTKTKISFNILNKKKIDFVVFKFMKLDLKGYIFFTTYSEEN